MEIDIQKIIERIHQLEKLREELLAGDLSPEGAWIHEYVIYKVEEAYQSWRNRKRLEAVVEVLTEIQSILTKAERLMNKDIEDEN